MTSLQPPSSIQELAERAEQSSVVESTRDFKQWLKAAERARHAGQAHDQAKDLENAFVEYARAATLILDKIPTHREYYTRLDDIQRDTLTTKGQQMLHRMDQIKPILIDRHNAWGGTAGPSRIQEGSRSSHSRDHEGKLRKPAPMRHMSMSTHANSIQCWHPDAAPAAQGKHRRDEGTRSRAEHHTRSEQAGIVQRQKETEHEARLARQNSISLPLAAPLESSSSHSSSFEAPPLLPLESPTQFKESGADKTLTDEDLYKKVADLAVNQPPVSIPFGMPQYQSITTTSEPLPNLGAIQYPQLMSQHQQTQGYTPSLRSMFIEQANAYASQPQSTLLLEPSPQLPSSLYPTLPPPAASSSHVIPYVERLSTSSPKRAFMFGPRERPSPPAPLSNAHSRSPRHHLSHESSQTALAGVAPRIAPASSAEKRELDSRVLKTVQFPRDVLPRFLSIASLNTARNRETCGLLLGKLKNERYVVTTLLIPRQHSTSDTCTMDEEELVSAFTESRSLITLGWIHTHPTQSCFMSSVDLHTHAGFQCMLPESFAVVCAPQHTPNFGIFRLTDPPGLRTVLDCTSKEAFHPHPDLPIYTDADKGHVQMRDMALEIVDLR